VPSCYVSSLDVVSATCTAKVASFVRCALRPGGDTQLISKFATMFMNFRAGLHRTAAKVTTCFEGCQIYGWSREDCRTLRGCARPLLGVALILTSRMYILCKYKHMSIQVTCQMLREIDRNL